MYESYNKNITFADRDDYERKGTAEKIIKIIESDIPISPMLIDGNWGEGKTEFCYKLINLLKEKNKKCIYLDAFTNDHIDDPLLIVFSAIASTFDEEKENDLKVKAMPLLAFGVKTLGKAGVSWILKQDSEKIGEDLENIIKNTSDSVFNAVAEKLIEDCQKQEENISTLQKAIIKATEDKKLIIFIDELDRCRPSFAVELLEKIKHVFNIPSVIFILITNKEQLIAAVNHIYGAEINANEYVNKFINLTVRLNKHCNSDVERRARALNSLKHLNILLLEFENTTLDCLRLNQSHKTLLVYLVEFNHLSLRQVEKIVISLRVFDKISDLPFSRLPQLIVSIVISLIFLESFAPSLAENIAKKTFTGKAIKNALNLPSFADETKPSSVRYLSAITEIIDYDNDSFPKELEKFSNNIGEQLQGYSYGRSLSENLRYLVLRFLNNIRLGDDYV